MQKYISLLVLSLFLLTQTTSNAQEGTKIPFDKGVLKICSSKNFIIKGHDGNEVIIKNLAIGTEIRTLYSNLRGNLTKPSQLGGTLTRSGNLKGTLTKNRETMITSKTFRTQKSTGLSLAPNGPGHPWLMDAGTYKAHIMISPVKPN